MKGFGDRLRRLRVDRGLSQEQLAGDRYTRAFISSLETGRALPSAEAITHLSAKLGFDLTSDLRQQVVAGWELLADGDLANAAQTFTGIDAPARLAFWAQLGLAEIAGDPARYERAERLLNTGPAHLRAPAIALRAACLARRGEPEYAAYLRESALAELTDAGLTDPTAIAWLTGVPADRADADPYCQLAQALNRLGHHEDADSAYDRAIELLARSRIRPPTSVEKAEGLRRLARSLADRGELDDAVKVFDQACAVVLAPSRPRS